MSSILDQNITEVNQILQGPTWSSEGHHETPCDTQWHPVESWQCWSTIMMHSHSTNQFPTGTSNKWLCLKAVDAWQLHSRWILLTAASETWRTQEEAPEEYEFRYRRDRDARSHGIPSGVPARLRLSTIRESDRTWDGMGHNMTSDMTNDGQGEKMASDRR